MESPVKLYEYFLSALNGYASKKGYGVQRNIALQAGITEAFVSQIMAGTNRASVKTQTAIAKACGFQTLENMLEAGRSACNQVAEDDSKYHLNIRVNSPADKSILQDGISDYHAIPLHESGRLAAGVNGMAFDPYESPDSLIVVSQLQMRVSAGHILSALKVGGDSMYPTIPQGAIIVVDLSDRDQIDGRIFVVNVPDGGIDMAAVKRVRRWDKGKGFILISDNIAYPPDISLLDWPRLCVGRVIWMSRDLRQY